MTDPNSATAKREEFKSKFVDERMDFIESDNFGVNVSADDVYSWILKNCVFKDTLSDYVLKDDVRELVEKIQTNSVHKYVYLKEIEKLLK